MTCQKKYPIDVLVETNFQLHMVKLLQPLEDVSRI